ncbi:class I SAM-dependent methyltransferase [Laceyella sacchari]|nr:class I SAM-dependent methyltransferase [Laceyella sacchari]
MLVMKSTQINEYYKKKYSTLKPSQYEWTSGTASPKLINMVETGVIPEGAKILDIGCGIGTEAVYLALNGYDVTGLDISKDAIEKGKQLAEFYGVEVNWLVADVLGIPIKSDSIDVVTDRGCFHCIRAEQREKFANEIARVLKQGGLYTMSCFSNQVPGNPYPVETDHFVINHFGVSSKEILETFSASFSCEKLELITNSKAGEKGFYGWHSMWYKL